MKKLLLHTCCAPCFTGVFDQIKSDFDITIFWFNPNISPKEEYEKRLGELVRYAKIVRVKVIVEGNYIEDNLYWNTLTKKQAEEPEGGKRCELCIRYRLLSTAKFASENSFEYFATTLTISPHKNSKLINKIGNDIEKILYSSKSLERLRSFDSSRLSSSNNTSNIKFLNKDFKKENGYLTSIQICREFNIYRQNYCGCQYSTKILSSNI